MDYSLSPKIVAQEHDSQQPPPDSFANGDSFTTPTSELPAQAELLPQDETDHVSTLQPGLTRLNLSDGRTDRRASVQFLPHLKLDAAEQSERSRSRKPLRDVGGRRVSSPPPPNAFRARVSFDTFDNRDASDFSLTLNRKHNQYAYTKRSRTFLCGTDANDYSDTALEWLIDELVDDGDEVVCLRVVEKESKEARDWAGPNQTREGREKGYRAEAQRMLERIQAKNTEDRAINLVLEFSIGKVQDTIQHMIRIYEPAILVVGTRGRSLAGFQGLLPGSVSKYCLQHSPVPVIVVRPSSKRDKKKRKRMMDPTRQGYRDILDKTEDGGHMLDERNRRSIIDTEVLSELGKRDADEEARKVAEAIGYSANQAGALNEGAPLSRIISTRSDVSGRSARSGSLGSYTSVDDDPRSPVGKLLKSPELRDLESPRGSEYGDSDSEDEIVPEYVQAQEEALMRARERAIKAEEEERQLEMELLEKKLGKTEKKKKKSTETNYGGASGALDLLSELSANEKQKRRGIKK